ncbi:MAG: flagellar filament capping protein FliD [Phycisphaerales bacterium]|nr:flagellar filament capping protein FliD [Phycisphaerales bacterium]
MGSISTGVGLISGIDTASLINNLIALQSTGLYRLQERMSVLQAEKSALLDVNARLLSVLNSVSTLTSGNLFTSVLGASSNPESIFASASNGAVPGTYSFIPKGLASYSQRMSKGFEDAESTALGLSHLSFEFGQGQLGPERELNELNGGLGVQRGSILITDAAGGQATIDLTSAVTLGDVTRAFNESLDVQVVATVDGDHLVLTDQSGGSGTLQVSGLGGSDIAVDLGLAAGTLDGTSLIGDSIYYLDQGSATQTLNDGLGVLIKDRVADIQVTARDGRVFNIDLSGLSIDAASSLSLLNDGEGVPVDTDPLTADLQIQARNGTVFNIDLSNVSTVGELQDHVFTETGGTISLSIINGERLTLTDNSGGAGVLKVVGAGEFGNETAEALGLLSVDGVGSDSLMGSVLDYNPPDSGGNTLESILQAINNAVDSNGVANNGAITANIASDGLRMELIDGTGGVGNLKVLSTASNANAAQSLGILTVGEGVAASSISGQRLLGDVNGVLLRNLSGGGLLDYTGDMTVKDRAGHSTTISGLGDVETISEMVKRINQQLSDAGVQAEVQIAESDNGLTVIDKTGTMDQSAVLEITGLLAVSLGISNSVASDKIDGENLQLKYIGAATKLEDLNYGRGIGSGTFRIIDGVGVSADVTVDSSLKTVDDLVQLIRSKGLSIKVGVNVNGDGLFLGEPAQNTGSFVPITVESVTGSTAQDLNIQGASPTIENSYIDGSYERVIEVNTSDTLNEIAAKVNDANIPVSATVLNVGSTVSPFRISFASSISGRAGNLIVDTQGTDLNLGMLTRAQDARLEFAAAEGESGFLVTSSTNTFDQLIEGLTLDLQASSTDPVTISVTRDTTSITAAVEAFVTSFNEAIARLEDYEFYDVESKQKGILLGDATAARVRESLNAVVRSRAEGLDTQFTYLQQVGITFGSGGQLEFDQEKFLSAYEQDRIAVSNLFELLEDVELEPEEVAPGVTVGGSNSTILARGLGPIIEAMLEGLTESATGTIARAADARDNQIELTESRIEGYEARLAAKRERLQREFAAMESILASMQSQSNSLLSLQNNIGLVQGAM